MTAVTMVTCVGVGDSLTRFAKLDALATQRCSSVGP